MRLKHLFLILVVLQLAAIALIILIGAGAGSTLFYIAEAIVLVNILYIIFFYTRLIRPLNNLYSGIDLLKSQDWNSRLRHVGQKDVDNISDIFNAMLTRLKQQRIRYEEQTHFVNLLIHAAPVGVVVADYSGKRESVNPAAIALLDKYPRLWQFMQEPAVGESADFNTAGGDTLRCSRHSFIDRGVTHYFYLVENISASVDAAERSAYEKIIRIIAHEVNNTVTGLTSAFDAVIPLLCQAGVAEDATEVLRSCAERSTTLSRFISRFADVVKIPQPVPVATTVNSLVNDNAYFLESLCMPRGIKLSVQLMPDDAPVMIDKVLMAQVLVNIVKNSVESIAICHKENGTIIIRTSLDNTKHPVLEIIDNGIGISEEKSQKLFTPFYTDKPDGQGIGLLFVRDVLRRHTATFTLSTDPATTLTHFNISFHSSLLYTSP
ncbi:MAG: PAS domain-containing sensor histidine kinase, partial [Muribaculaceae bacterium]